MTTVAASSGRGVRVGGRGPSRRGAPAGARWASRVRRRYRPGLAGTLYLATTLFLAVGAINSQNNLLFWAFGLALGGLLISGVVSGSALMGVEIERLPAPSVAAGERLTIRYHLWNRNRVVPAFCLQVEEVPTRRGAGRESDWSRRMSTPRAFISHLAARQALHGEAVVWPAHRGEAVLGPLAVSSTFPFGLMRKSVEFRQPGRVLVHPARVRLRAGVVQRLLGGGREGPQLSRRVGTGEEFFGLREYRPGDSLREIAWRPSARLDELVVRQRAQSAPKRLWVVLDLEGRGSTADSREGAIALGGEMVRRAVEREYAVGLALEGRGVVEPPRRNAGHERRLLDALALAEREERHENALSGPGERDSTLVVHAGAVREGVGPRGAVRLSALEASGLLEEGAELPRAAGGRA